MKTCLLSYLKESILSFLIKIIYFESKIIRNSFAVLLGLVTSSSEKKLSFDSFEFHNSSQYSIYHLLRPTQTLLPFIQNSLVTLENIIWVNLSLPTKNFFYNPFIWKLNISLIFSCLSYRVQKKLHKAPHLKYPFSSSLIQKLHML